MSLDQPRAPDEKYCFACAHLMHVSSTACPRCGAAQTDASALALVARPAVIPANSVFCYACGTGIHRDAFTCPKCGAQQVGMGGINRKNRIVAAVLAFLLGGIGGHKFYLGQVGLGIIYLVFCWTFIPGVIALIEGLIYLFDTDESFARKYAR